MVLQAASAARVIRDRLMLLKSARRAAEQIGHPSNRGCLTMPTALPTPIDANAERLLEHKLESRPRTLPPRERRVEAALALLALGASLALALFGHPARSFSPPLALAFMAVYAVVNRVEFRVGDGNIVPTQLLVFPMLLLLPTPIVPLLIAGAMVAGAAELALRGVITPQQMLLGYNDATFALAPAAVLVALGAQTPAWSAWPAYAAALATQFA